MGRATRKHAAGIQTEAGLRVAAPPAPPAASRAGEVRHGLSKGGGRASRHGGGGGTGMAASELPAAAKGSASCLGSFVGRQKRGH